MNSYPSSFIMKNSGKCLLAGFLWLTVTNSLHTQNFVYKIGYFGFLDNREYFNEFANDQTIFGSRIYGEAGYTFNERNRIMAGANYLYEFGSKGEWIAPDITAYFSGRYKHLDFLIGAFPRANMTAMPLALMTDTLGYYRPNMEGILLDYGTQNFHHNLWIDWTSRQSYQKRETFLLGFSGYAKIGIFLYQHHFIMTHLAHSLAHGSDELIRDNAGFSLMPGVDLSAISGLDSLTFSAGLLGSYDRIRSKYDFRFPLGFYAELEAAHKGFGVHGILYAGESQVITSGDGFYKSDFYSRADAFYRLSASHIEGRLQFSFHFIPDMIDLSMSLLVRAQLDGMFRSHQSTSPK